MEKNLFQQLLGYDPTVDELHLLWSDVESLRPLVAKAARENFGVRMLHINREQRRTIFSRCRGRSKTATGALITQIRELQVAY